MPLKYPESMDECVYFTRREIGNSKAMCWVFREQCSTCKNAMMGKPVEAGKVKIRAKEYSCPACGHTEEKEAYEEKLTANISYTCPKCRHEGETQIPFKRKSVEGTKALVFSCQKCGERMLITKKMKSAKKKGESAFDDEEEK